MNTIMRDPSYELLILLQIQILVLEILDKYLKSDYNAKRLKSDIKLYNWINHNPNIRGGRNHGKKGFSFRRKPQEKK